jgi:hypothetical protein
MREQMSIFDIEADDCPFKELTEDYDDHCNESGSHPRAYQVISENSPTFGESLAAVRGVGFNDVRAEQPPLPSLPSYIPSVSRGSGKLFTGFSPGYIAIGINHVISPVELNVVANLHQRIGVPETTKIVITGYAKDPLIEAIWPNRRKVFRELAQHNFALITPINYSIWDNQPHAERLINLKRGLLTYEALLKLGLPTIPHIYWYGPKDLDRWLVWLNLNPSINTVAINLQTLRGKHEWKVAISDLNFFVAKLSRPLHYIVTGPQSPQRIEECRQTLGSITLINGHAARAATAYKEVVLDGAKFILKPSTPDTSSAFQRNIEAYSRAAGGQRTQLALHQPLATSDILLPRA